MVKRPRYRIEYAPEAIEHLKDFGGGDAARILDGVDKQLLFQPALPTRNRAPLRSNVLAAYRLRIGKLRVYYDVRDEPERVVVVKAIGIKSREKVLVGGLEIDL